MSSTPEETMRHMGEIASPGMTGTEIKSVRGGIPPLPEKKKFLDRFRKKKDDQKKNA